MVLKAPQATPFSAALLCEILLDAGLPPGHVNLVQGPGSEVGRWLVENQTIRFFTFTGSTEVGRQLQRAVGLRPIALELGSIAGTIVCDDGDLDRAAPRIANSAFRRAGQACTSTQRLFVQDTVLERVHWTSFVEATARLKVGDPARPGDRGRSDDQRGRGGARRGVGRATRSHTALGRRRRSARSGALLSPTILPASPRDMQVAVRRDLRAGRLGDPVPTLDEAIAQVNATPFGLAAGHLYARHRQSDDRGANACTSASCTSTSRPAAVST